MLAKDCSTIRFEKSAKVEGSQDVDIQILNHEHISITDEVCVQKQKCLSF
jgi:hypothetical protein